MTSDPTVLRSWRGSSPRGFWPVWVRFEGTGKEGKRTWKMSCAWPLQRRHHQLWKLTLYHPEKKERTLQPLMNFIPLLAFPFPPWSVTLLSPSPRKSERGLLVFGACCYTDQGLGTMWFLRCRPGGERRQAWAGPCGTVVKSSALETRGEVSPINVKICVV